MLGSDGPRTYLMVSLNSAELRSAGGIVGAFAVLHAEDGAVSIGDQRSTIDLSAIAEPILPLTDEELNLDTDRLGRWVQDSVLTPDFPRTAQLLAARWEQDTGQHVDGVVAADPVGARYLLSATGPVTAKDGTTVTSSDVVRVLLHDAYHNISDPAAVDAFYADVAASIFSAVGAGQGDTHGLVTALAKAGSEGRVRIWSASPDEQKALAATTIGGAFLSGADSANATGVFLNDGTAGKLDYYLTTKVTVEDLQCVGPDPTATVRLDLSYAPPAEVAQLPTYVTGPGRDGLPRGSLATNISFYSAVGGSVGPVGLDDGFVGGKHGTASGPRRRAGDVHDGSWRSPDVPDHRPRHGRRRQRVDHPHADRPGVRGSHLPLTGQPPLDLGVRSLRPRVGHMFTPWSEVWVNVSGSSWFTRSALSDQGLRG